MRRKLHLRERSIRSKFYELKIDADNLKDEFDKFCNTIELIKINKSNKEILETLEKAEQMKPYSPSNRKKSSVNLAHIQSKLKANGMCSSPKRYSTVSPN